MRSSVAIGTTVLNTEVLKCLKADNMTFVLVFQRAGYFEKVVTD